MTAYLHGTNGVIFPDSTSLASRNDLFAYRNKIINGNMVIDQRNAGASVTPADAQYLVDRWVAGLTQASKWSAQQNQGAVTPPAGFSNYLGCTSASAYAVTSTDFFGVSQKIEGLNVADLAWGTASAKTVTLSFWVRSSLTGTFGGSLQNSAGTRSYPFTYSVSAANTWEQKSITIAGDTTGAWLTTNGIGVRLTFSLGMGSTFSGTAGAWAAANLFSATGAVSVVGTSAATWYVTGVQLEIGSVATPFEHRPYGMELALCQRYYQQYFIGEYAGYAGAINARLTTLVPLPVQMRVAPTRGVITAGTLANIRSSSTSFAGLCITTGTSANAVPLSMESAAVGSMQIASQTESLSAEL